MPKGSMMPPLFALLVIGRLGLLGRPAAQAHQAMLDVHLDWLETELADRPWFAGPGLTAADVMMSFPIEASRTRAGLGASRPNLIDLPAGALPRPPGLMAVRSIKGGPYALPEPLPVVVNQDGG
jgi:glutathione S-transferase